MHIIIETQSSVRRLLGRLMYEIPGSRVSTDAPLCSRLLPMPLFYLVAPKMGSISPSFVSNSRNLLNLRGGLRETQFTAGRQKYKAPALQVASYKFKTATCNFPRRNFPPCSEIGLHLIFNGLIIQKPFKSTNR